MRAAVLRVLALLAVLVPLLAALPAAASAESPGGRALDWAEAHAAGHWYVYGGTGPAGYDCSGLVSTAILRATGIWVGRTTYEMLASPRLVRVPVAGAPRGALMFYGSGHVELNTAWPHTTFGAQQSGTRIWWHSWSGWWQPTMAFVIR